MRRDQLPGPPEATDPAGWLVLNIVRSAPLRIWPAELPDLPVEDRWASTLWHAWLEAAAWEQDADWAARLIPHEPGVGGTGPGRPGGRAAFVAKLLAAFPAPWPRELSLAVLGWLQARAAPPFDQYPHDSRRVLALAARRLPVEAAGRLDAVGRRWPAESGARYAFAQAAQVMIYRRTMFEELQ
jgi:hypothetical protein